MPNIQPMIIGIWCGESKPKPINEYFLAFVNEVNQLIENGITVNEWRIKIGVRCFICDSPARALIKGKFSFIVIQYFSIIKNQCRKNKIYFLRYREL